MLIVFRFLDRWIDKPHGPVIPGTVFIVVLQYLYRLAPYLYEPFEMSTENGFTINPFRQVRHMDIHIDLPETHIILTSDCVRHNDYVLFGVIVPFVINHTANHGLYLALLEHLVNPNCYFLGRYHIVVPNISFALAFALSISFCMACGKSVFAFSSAGSITL